MISIYKSLSFIAGLPAYTPFFVISLVTTDPAPITQPEQIFTGKIVELLRIVTESSIIVLFQSCLLPFDGMGNPPA